MIDDDLLQKRAQGYVSPESFTNGTSEQRSYSLRLGLQAVSINATRFARCQLIRKT